MLNIVGYELFACTSGGKVLRFLKVTDADGVAGWAEYNENLANSGVTSALRSFAELVKGRGSSPAAIIADLTARRAEARGGVGAQAVGALSNALLDLQARRAGLSVADLLGGALRERLPAYWSHCGMYRLPANAESFGNTPVRTLDDLAELGAEVRERGFRAFKTSLLPFGGDGALSESQMVTYWRSPGSDLFSDRAAIASVERQLEAFRRGAGDDVLMMLDANFLLRGDGNARLARSVERFDLAWLELDDHRVSSLRALKDSTTTPIASCESLHRLEDYLPFLQAAAVDVAIVDVVWNGVVEGRQIARLAEAMSINVATHHFGGHLTTAMEAQFGATVPNLSILEVDVDIPAWFSDLVSEEPRFLDGELVVPPGPGWGIDVNEEAVRAYAVDGSEFADL
ncbi:mandelate racemase/muconate lactonizing enzyme family protein [Microbacterium sp.]|uniref:mandelate racemase/muconate lactonizing enzyme family protein n=1 Tax=Microbacterium sp. TaxID=51671 RepID=UPI003C77D2F8